MPNPLAVPSRSAGRRAADVALGPVKLGPVKLGPVELGRVALGSVALVLVLFALAACGGPAGSPESFDPNAPHITAQSEKFDTEELDVPGNQGFELVLVNKDSESHNLSIYSDEARTKSVYHGSLAANGTSVYHVQALAPGTYYFQCDVHPVMKGVVVAAAG